MLALWLAPGEGGSSSDRSAVNYDRLCAPCHGATGAGNGPAAALLWPLPRDFTRGDYKWRSTPTGAPPTDLDLEATIRFGAAGTSMPGFDRLLSDEDIKSLVVRVKGFAPKKFGRAAAPVDIGGPPKKLDPYLGKEVYERLGCAACHGADGAGDGPSAASLKDASGRKSPPFDLRKSPLRRPTTSGQTLTGLYTTLVTGLGGTAMPSYEGAAPAADLWAVAAYVDSLRSREPQPENRAVTVQPIESPPDGEPMFTGIIPPQGPVPAALAPAQGSLHAGQCGRCHAKQHREWSGSIHSHAMAPGILAQLVPHDGKAKSKDFLDGCQRCHAPLSEQSSTLSMYDAELRDEGINCASCHVRGWKRHGPPALPGSSLLPIPGYPFEPLAVYERADFCMGCHQLPANTAVNGKPRLNTYREWLEGPYMRRGIQCQSCHMPNREHTFKGIHDPQTFRQGIDVTTAAERVGQRVRVAVSVKNIGAGHYLPTTPTPAAWISLELLDEDGETISGSFRERRIGWHLVFDKGWKELADTRIPPGESLKLAGEFAARDARAVRVRVRVAPDDFYQGFYERRLKSRMAEPIKRLFEQALERTKRSRYVAYDRTVPIQ